ncbi:hypothetical protein J7J18_04350 [bacterium]|nr:hypothetical protein [bacterium]
MVTVTYLEGLPPEVKAALKETPLRIGKITAIEEKTGKFGDCVNIVIEDAILDIDLVVIYSKVLTKRSKLFSLLKRFGFDESELKSGDDVNIDKYLMNQRVMYQVQLDENEEYVRILKDSITPAKTWKIEDNEEEPQ